MEVFLLRANGCQPTLSVRPEDRKFIALLGLVCATALQNRPILADFRGVNVLRQTIWVATTSGKHYHSAS